MDKVKTLQGQRKSLDSIPIRKLKKGAKVYDHNATERLLDEDFIAGAIWECLKENDPEGVLEIIETHLEIVNKVKASEKNELSRSTMYHAMKGKNPTLKTLAKMISCFINNSDNKSMLKMA